MQVALHPNEALKHKMLWRARSKLAQDPSHPGDDRFPSLGSNLAVSLSMRAAPSMRGTDGESLYMQWCKNSWEETNAYSNCPARISALLLAEAIAPRIQGRRGRIAKPEPYELSDQLAKHEESMLRFLCDSQVRFAKNAGVRAMRMANVTGKCRAAFERERTERPMHGARATSCLWPHWPTILWSPAESRSTATPPTRSSNTPARH